MYDNVYEALVIMSKPAGHPDPGIPAVFVSRKSGDYMKSMMAMMMGPVRVRIVQVGHTCGPAIIVRILLL